MTKIKEPSRSDTRTRIVETCRALFNERGPGAVTTAEIAGAVGINEGNLYYHFKRKERMLEALFDDFERALHQASAAYLALADHPDRYRDYLGGWFNVMWEWRFFYRDGAVVFALAPALKPRLKRLSDAGQAQTRQALTEMQKAGLVKIAPGQLDDLVTNAWIVSTYWIDYLRSRGGVTEVTRDHVAWGARQVMTLFLPYLTPRGLKLADIRPRIRKE